MSGVVLLAIVCGWAFGMALCGSEALRPSQLLVGVAVGYWVPRLALDYWRERKRDE